MIRLRAIARDWWRRSTGIDYGRHALPVPAPRTAGPMRSWADTEPIRTPPPRVTPPDGTQPSPRPRTLVGAARRPS